MTDHLHCDHHCCVASFWPGSPLQQLLEPPGTMGIVVTAAMRGRLSPVAERVRYGRELLAEVTLTPAWDSAGDQLRARVARAMRNDLTRWTRSREDPVDALQAARSGQRWIPADLLNQLIIEMERRCGGDELPPLGQRLRGAGVQGLVVFEPNHVHATTEFWRDCPPAGMHVVLAHDPGGENPAHAYACLPQHQLEAPLQIASAVRSVLAVSPARRGDTPPPTAGGPPGVVSLHRIEGVDRHDMAWLTASALASSGAHARSQDLAPITLPASIAERGVLVVVPAKADEPLMRRDLERHLTEPVVMLRSGRDDPMIERCREMLEAVATGDQQPFARTLLDRVRYLAPTQTGVATAVLTTHRGLPLAEWLTACETDLRANRALKPFAGKLRTIARHLHDGPGLLIPALNGLVDLEARHRPRQTVGGASMLTPTVQRAAAASSIDEGLEVLMEAGWSPSRPVEYTTGQPRIVVAAANRIGATTADVVIITRSATRGFTGSDGRRADRSDEAQRTLYACLASAREQIHVLHRGHNDLMPWAEAINGVVVRHHNLPGWRPTHEG
jgi:hypothetical protein